MGSGRQLAADGRLRVLVLARSYPNRVLGTLGLWVERPLLELAPSCEIKVVSPVPYCPPLPSLGGLRQYTRFRDVPRAEVRAGIEVHHPRLVVGPGLSLYALEDRAYHLAVRGTVERLWRSFPFDLIHATFIYPDGVVAHRLSRQYGVPFVVTEHAPWLRVWMEKRNVLRTALPAAADAGGLIAVSEYCKRTIVDYTDDPDRVEVIPNGIDETVFRPGPPEERDPDRILFVGQVNFNKGLDVLLRALQRVFAHRPQAKLTVAGGFFYRNTRLQAERIRQMAHDLGLADRVEFVGVKPPHEVAKLMRTSAVLVLPSRAESFGAVLIEALASGTPVVATRCGGPEDIVTDDVGQLVGVEDETALGDAILCVLATPERYPSDALRRYALARFTWTQVAERTAGVYEQALRSTQSVAGGSP